MAYDRELAARVREILTGQPVVEKAMFGGLSFMVNDKIAVTASNEGDLLVRCDPDQVDELLGRAGAEWARMRGRPMSRGWLRIRPGGFENDQLRFWVDIALTFNADLTEDSSRPPLG